MKITEEMVNKKPKSGYFCRMTGHYYSASELVWNTQRKEFTSAYDTPVEDKGPSLADVILWKGPYSDER